MSRVYNFSAGPSVLPESVLQKAAAEMLDYQGTGQSVMEMSHRSKPYEAIINGCEALIRENMGISDDYHVLFLQGGASLQFYMLPLNFMTTGDHLIAHFRDGDWESAGVELFVLATGIAAAAVVRRLHRAPAAQSRRSVSVARKAAGSIAQPESGV